MWIILALITAVFWAIGNVLLKKGVMALPNSLIYLGNAIFFLGLWLIYLLINGGWQSQPLAWIIAILPPLGFVYALTALKKNNAGLVLAVGSIHPAVTAILAVSFLGESLSVVQWGLIIMAVMGVVIMSYSGKVKIGAWLWWGLIFGIWGGINNFVSKFAIGQTNVVSYSLMLGIWQMIFAFGFLTLEKQWGSIKLLVSKKGRIGLIGTGIYNIGSVAFFLALGVGAVSLVMPVVNLSTPITLFLALWWLKEKMTIRQLVGAGVIIVSVIGLAVI